MNNRLKFQIGAVVFLTLAFFSFGAKAQADCVWQIMCDNSHSLDSPDGGFCPLNTKPNPTSRCCCNMSSVTIPGGVSNTPPQCTWQIPSNAGSCGLLTTASVFPDNSCAGNSAKPDATAKCCCLLAAVPLTQQQPAAVLKNPFDSLNVEIPGLYQAAKCKKNGDGTYTCPQVNCEAGDNGAANCQIPWIAQYLVAIYNYSLIIIGALAAVTMMAGGIMWLISGSNASRMKTAKEMIVGSVSGLIIMFSSYMIISVVNPDLLMLKPISLSYIEPVAPEISETSSADGNPFQAGCDAARKGDLSVCQNFVGKSPAFINYPGTNKKFTQQFADKLQAAMSCIQNSNGGVNPFSISAGSRSVQTTLDLWQAYKSGGVLAARPCCSNHLTGAAVDLKRADGVNWFTMYLSDKNKRNAFISDQWSYIRSKSVETCMNQNGIYGKIPSEPWHWSLSGN